MLKTLEQQSESLFLVSSAIHTKHGVYSPQQRLEQTIETLKSIKDRCDADIVILDGGDVIPTEDEQAQLTKYARAIVSFSDAPSVMQVLAVPNQDIVKNMAEIIIFGTIFQEMEINKDYEKYKRIFKMSGRYVLNDDFDYQTHLNAKKKIIIRGPFTSQFTAAITGGVIFQYMSRLWSFDAEMLPYITQCYRDMFANINSVLSQGGYIDIEHLLFAHLNPDYIQRIKKIGIEGNIAPSGAGVSE